MNTRLTYRDIELLKWVAKLKYVSTSLAAEFFFDGNIRIARRRLKRLSEAGYLSWFFRPAPSRGNLEHVFYLNKKRKEELCFILESTPSFYVPPRNPLLTNHDLTVSKCILCLQRCCETNKQYSFQFFTANEGQSKDTLPFTGKNRKTFVPDCTIKLNGSKGSSLVFLEVDMGTESIIAASRKKSDVQKKLKSYLAYWNYEGHKRLSKKLGYSFKGFRLLMVTTMPRMQTISELCNELDCGFVWLTTFDKIHSLFNKVWLVPCSNKKELRTLVTS